MITSCKINKKPNNYGNYSCQYVENNKIKICCFRSYEEGISYAYFNWGLEKETHLQNSVILQK